MTTALLLIDLQNDYFNDDELARCRDDLLDRSNQLIRAARDAGAPVVEVRTVHARDKSTWALNMLDDDQGMAIEGTEGVRRLDGLLGPDLCIVKTRDSAFHGTDLAAWLADRDVDRLVLAGVSTESCIAATATASVEWRLHDETLARLEKQYRQEVVSAADVRFR